MAEQTTVKRKLSDVLGRDLVQVFTDRNGMRYIWMLGYGIRDKRRTLGFVWTHFNYNILPLEAFINDTRLDGILCNKLYNNDRKVFLEEIDKYDCKYYYSDAETEGPLPFFVRDMSIPDGYYIV
jgi:hypothetical protein